MNLENRKLTLIEEIISIQNEELISIYESLLRKIMQLKNNEIKPMTIEELNKRIDKSLKDSKAGRFITNDDLISEIEKWT